MQRPYPVTPNLFRGSPGRRSAAHDYVAQWTPEQVGNYPFETWFVIPAKAGIHSGGLSG